MPYLSTDPWAGVLGDAEQQTGLQPGLLNAIASQENVSPRHNNPLGLSTDSGVMSFAPDDAISRIHRQAQLLTNPSGPYRDFARSGSIDDLARVYSPPGARNDLNGTNSTEASGIRRAMRGRYLSTDPDAGKQYLSLDPGAAEPSIPSPTLAQEVGASPDFIAPPKPEGTVFTDANVRDELVKNVRQGLKDFIPTLKHGVETSVPHNRQELVDSLADVTRQAAAPYEESMYRTVGPEKYDQPQVDLSSPYALVPGLPPGLIPELAKIKGPIGDYIRSQTDATPKHEPSGYERFGASVLGAASQLTTPHSAADIYSFKTPGAQQAFAAERLLSVPEQAEKAKQAYQEQGLPEAAASALNDAVMDILPSLHDAGRLKAAGQYADLLPSPEAGPVPPKSGEVYFQPGDAEATAKRATGAQISPELLQAISRGLQRQDTGLPALEGEANSPNYLLENAIEKALRRTTSTPLRSATDLATTNKKPVAQLDENANDVSIPNVPRPVETPMRPEKEPAQGAETDLAPEGTHDKSIAERPDNTDVRGAARLAVGAAQEIGSETGSSLNNEATELGRADRGLPEPKEVLSREFGKSYELAQKKEAAHPGYGRRLVDRLQANPKALDDVEHSALLDQTIQAENEFDGAIQGVNDNPGDSEAAHALDIARERLQKTYTAAENAGTGTGRGLNIRKAIKARDYSLPRMEARFRAEALKGKELSYAQTRAIAGIHERITAADKVLGPETQFFAGLDPEEAKKLARSIKVINRNTEDYKARTQAKDTSPRKPKADPLMSDEKAKALYEREKAKADYHQMIAEEQYKEHGKLYRGAAQVASYPRRVAVAGHGIVFPVTHAGDLILRPASWGTFSKGFVRTYASTFNKDFHAKTMGRMQADPLFHLATRSGVDVGMGFHGAGLVKTEGMASRAWDALKVMRFELWKNQMRKYVKDSMSEADKLDLGKNLASWANHATGSGRGILADSKVGQMTLFGPKLTQSKINRLSVDPAKTIATFANWGKATLGEKAAAKARLSGAVQYATTLAGFLVANGAILQALGSKQKINLTDPNKSDFWSFKIAGTDIAIPGLHSEMRYLAQILATTTASRKELRGQSRQGAIFDKGSQYLRSKLAPTPQLVAEGATSQDYRGRPLPWSKEKPTKFLPKYGPVEYATTKAPIPSTGPAKYVFDQMRDKGMSATDAAFAEQALTIFGLGLTGMHVHEDYPEKPKKH